MIKKFKDGLRDLKTILKKKDNQKTRNRTNERNNKIRAEKIDKLNRLDKNLSFSTRRNKFHGRSNSSEQEEEIELTEITSKKINAIHNVETERKEVEELNIERESKTTKSLADLYSEI